jgi:uncharacterized protein YifN (PemK superfamily)
MKNEEIKVGHVYYVQFNPVRFGEFDKEHLAVVLQKNDNNITYVVIPLSSNEKGDNRIELHIKELLPENLQKNNTYAIYDQVRTVNASRFHNLKSHGEIFDVIVPEEEMNAIYEAVIKHLLKGIDEKRFAEIVNACKKKE